MKLTPAELADASEKITRFLRREYPSLELHELGALFVSSGCYLTASAIPDLWPQLKPAAMLAHQLLNQTTQKNNETLNVPNRQAEADHRPD